MLVNINNISFNNDQQSINNIKINLIKITLFILCNKFNRPILYLRSIENSIVRIDKKSIL